MELLEISSHWAEEQTKCEKCFLCEEIIYSNVYRLVFDIGERKEETNIILCHSCYNTIKKDV